MGIGDTLNFVIFDYWNQKIMRVIPLFAPIPVLFLNIKIIDSQTTLQFKCNSCKENITISNYCFLF